MEYTEIRKTRVGSHDVPMVSCEDYCVYTKRQIESYLVHADRDVGTNDVAYGGGFLPHLLFELLRFCLLRDYKGVELLLLHDKLIRILFCLKERDVTRALELS